MNSRISPALRPRSEFINGVKREMMEKKLRNIGGGKVGSGDIGIHYDLLRYMGELIPEKNERVSIETID